MLLRCANPHSGPHRLGLDARMGGTGPTVREVARTALLHAFTGEEDNPQAALAQAVLDRPGDPPVSAEEAEALIAAVASGREYMLDNHYADDHDFPEDAMAAMLLERHLWVDICWRAP